MKRLTASFILTATLFASLRAETPVSTDDFIARTDFDTTCLNLGEIHRSAGEQPFSFRAVNSGNAPLVLTYVHASCGCVRLNYPRHPIAPGDTVTISGVLNPGSINEGDFKRNILVRSNAEPPQTRLFIIGKIRPEANKE